MLRQLQTKIITTLLCITMLAPMLSAIPASAAPSAGDEITVTAHFDFSAIDFDASYNQGLWDDDLEISPLPRWLRTR